MKKPRFWYCDKTGGLVLDTPVGLSQAQMDAACKYVAGIYSLKFKSLPPGDRKDTVAKGLKALKENRVTQRVVGRNDFEVDRIMLGAH